MAKKADKSFEGDVLVVKFIESGAELRVDLNDIPQEIVLRLAKHGLSQKVGDSYAGAEAGESFARAEAVAKDLVDGNWSTRVAAAGPKSTQLAEALHLVTGKTLEECAELIDGMDDERKKALRNHDQVNAQLASLKAARAAVAAEKAQAAAAESGSEPLVL